MVLQREIKFIDEYQYRREAIKKHLGELGRRAKYYLEYLGDSNALTEPALKLMDAYVQACPDTYSVGADAAGKLVVIMIACFWIASKFCDDNYISLKHIKFISGGTSRYLIVQEELRILLLVNFELFEHMVFKEEGVPNKTWEDR